MRLLALLVLLGVPLAGCLGPSTGQPGVAAACAPSSGEDPYPQDELFANRSAQIQAEALVMQACLVNGRDSDHTEECGSAAGPVRVEVRNATSREVVFSRPYKDVGYIAACQTWTLPADREWPDARFNATWDLRKDVCAEDDGCDHRGEGDRVPGGPYVVEIRYPSFVEEWQRRVQVPAR